ncbi:hypothetical protein CN491_24890 [Bacillus cereus]|uniref:Uncharacterized protein n=1 Tax=Bacillus cereus TaxID=1396 RepID=A0A2B2FXF3_BACCE|nr:MULTISPECIES: hypothetical protein [Bacillus cereus group]PES90329.1 hypothetical protein CN491_24890 [Bacillus cereus]PFP74392.1 hypothetical protein COJ95_20080 [Bacillus cereus]PGT18557.1 hypothetical protein COC96_10800 [Bacillus cereus]
MDFRKYEYNIQQFLDHNYTNLKNIKVGASEESIQGFIKNEVASINSYTRGLLKEIRRDVGNYLDERFEPAQADDLMERFRKLMPEVPIEPIQLEKREVFPEPIQLEKREVSALERFEKRREKELPAIITENITPISICTGAVSAAIVTGVKFATVEELSFLVGAKTLGLTFVIVAGMTCAIIKILDIQGKTQEVYIKGSESPIDTRSTKTRTRGELKRTTIETALVVRRKEMEVKLLKAISDSERQFEKIVNG